MKDGIYEVRNFKGDKIFYEAAYFDFKDILRLLVGQLDHFLSRFPK